MKQLLDSPPEAYETDVPPHARHTIVLGDPIGPETPEQAQARAHETCLKALDGGLGAVAQDIVNAEARLYGMELNAGTISEFLEARRAKIMEFDQALAESFGDRVPGLITQLARDVADEDEDPAAIETMLQERMASVWTYVEDPLMPTGQEIAGEQYVAQFDDVSRAIGLNYGALVKILTATDPPPVIDKQFFDEIAEHESLHALFAVWYDPGAEGYDAGLTNGIHFWNDHGWWINEGTIERYRERLSEDARLSDDGAVLALAVADEFDPDFEQARLRAAVLNEDHGDMVGRLELLFGPDAPARIATAIDVAKTRYSGVAGYRKQLLDMLPRDRRERGRQAFDAARAELEARQASVRNIS